MESTRTDKIMTDAEWRKLSAASRARCNQYGIEFDNAIRERDALTMRVKELAADLECLQESGEITQRDFKLMTAERDALRVEMANVKEYLEAYKAGLKSANALLGIGSMEKYRNG